MGVVAVSCWAGCVSSMQPEPPAPYSPKSEPRTPEPEPAPESLANGPISPQKKPNEEPRQESCGSLPCSYFPTVAAALHWLVTETNPQIIGFGEAHAQSGHSGPSTALRFGEELLPSLAQKARFLLVELIQPPTGCAEARKQVQTESDAITKGQAQDNQNDYLTLGHRARALQVPVDILRPDCVEFEAIASAPEPLFRMMTSIAELSARRLIEEKKGATAVKPLVLTYGGALHNDAVPRPGFEEMSFGPTLVAATDGRYVELDLVLAEGLGTSAWSRLPWFEATLVATKNRKGVEAVLIERSPQSYALLLAPRPPGSEEPPEHLKQEERDHR